MNRQIALILPLLLLFFHPAIAADDDAATNITALLQHQIDSCTALPRGGVVTVPDGTYQIGTITLKSNVELHLSDHTRLISSRKAEDFPLLPPHPQYRSIQDHDQGWLAMIYAVDAHHIAITGRGTIDGLGKGNRVKHRVILFIGCQHVQVDGITLRNSPYWMQHYLGCSHVNISHITSYNHAVGNNDGIDIDGCQHVTLTHSTFDSDDDAIVLKSTGPAACQHITITDCTASSYANAIKCGTESTGGFRDIVIQNCRVRPSMHQGDRVLKATPTGISAISLELVDGGVMKHVRVKDIDIEGTECPIYVRLAARNRPYSAEAPVPATGTMSHITIENIRARNVGNFGSSITGVPGHCVQHITLRNIEIQHRGGLQAGNYRTTGDLNGKRHDMAKDHHLDQYWPSADDIVEDEAGYPQPTVWGNLPCYGLFARHVRKLRLQNLTFTPMQSDPREEMIMVDVEMNKK